MHDPSGATVAKAEVTISNQSSGITRTTLSSSDGVFQASSLPPADGYIVMVKMSGFSPSTTTGIVVHVGEIVNVPVTLALAGVANDVTVVGNAVDINTTDPGVSALVSQEEINDLPINGRRADQFVLLTPGVTTDGAGGEVTFRGVPGNNLFLQDGMDVT